MSAIKEAIENLSAGIAADPAKAGAKGTPATARLAGGLRCEVSGPRNERMATDMPRAMGGEAAAPNPGWFLRGAIASCAATVIAMRAAKLNIALRSLEVTVESDSDLRGILGLDDGVCAGQSAVRMKVRISGDAPPQALRELVQWADRHSPVGCTLRTPPAYLLDVEVA